MAETSLKGRPRLTEDDLEARIKAYCKSYGPGTNAQGLPEFPAGRRETPQHREWITLYKLWNRLGRRRRGQCDRCQEPAVEGSVFCEAHRAEARAPSGGSRLPLEDRHRLMAGQKGVCPICSEKLDVLESVPHAGPAGETLLHPGCKRLAGLAGELGRDGVDRLRTYLWPKSSKQKA